MDSPSTSPSAPGRLQDRLAEGRADAFVDAYDLYGERLMRCARWMTGSREAAEDAVQDLFIALVKSRERLRFVDDLAAYLFVGLRRLAAKAARRTPLAALPDDGQGLIAPEDERPKLREQLETALLTLPPEQQAVLILKLDGDLTFAQIARTLDISPNTAASRYRYGLEKLRAILDPASDPASP